MVANILLSNLGALYISTIYIIIFAAFHIYYVIKFHRHMASIGFPSTNKYALFSADSYLGAGWAPNRIATTWLLSRMHIGLIVGSCVVVALGLLRSFLLREPEEFQRIGAIVVIAGLCSTLLGLREARCLRESWRKIIRFTKKDEHKEFARDIMSHFIDGALARATFFSVSVSTIGTIIWAYGDQIIKQLF